MGDVVLRGAQLVGGDRAGTTADVRLRGDRIEAVGSVVAQPDDDVRDLSGYVLSVAAVEPHAHLDKAFLAERLPNATGDLLGAIAAMVAGRPDLGVADTVERAERAARMMAANGYRTVRTHADVTTDHGLRSIEALVDVRRRVADVIDVEIVALCGWPVCRDLGASQRALLVEAMRMGADLVGGCPHLEADGRRDAAEVLLDVAATHEVGVDLHTDETLDPSVEGLAELAELVVKTGFPFPVTASHCVSLGMQSLDRQREVAEAVAAAGITVVVLPATNLYLQGRDHQQAMPRGLTAVKALLEAGVVVAAGADNLQDPFNPMGRACPFETAALMVLTTHITPEVAWSMVTDRATLAIGQQPEPIAAGGSADLVAVRATSLREAMASGPPDRFVWRRGELLT